MKRRKIFIITFLILGFVILLYFFDNQKSTSNIPKERYIIQFNGKINEKLIQENGGEIKNKIEIINALVVELTPKKAQELKKYPKIKSIEKSKKGTLTEPIVQ